MKSQNCLLLLSSWLIGGCAAYEMPPLSTNHPAHAEAMGSPGRPTSRTLVYTQADIPSTRPALASVAPQGGQGALGNAQQLIVADGKVVATVPNASQIVVEHGEIKGFMDAMTMGYRVDPPSILDGLKSGDKVRFTIDVPKKAIVKIEKGPVLAATTPQKQEQGSRAAEAGPQKTVVAEGKVVATVPGSSQIVVEHGEIKGFMEAMTMGYPVDPPSLLEGLKFGDRVRFTIDVGKKAIVKIEKIK